MMTPTLSQFHSQRLLLLLPTILLILAATTGLFVLATAAEEQLPIARPYCRDKCGNISIPYPFDIGPGCFLAGQFEVYCNDSASSPRAFLVVDGYATYQLTGEATISASVRFPFVLNETAISPSPIELMDISVARNEARAYGTVSSYCSKPTAEQVLKLQLTSLGPDKTLWPLNLSKRNSLVGIGKNVEARLANRMYMDYPSSDPWLESTCTSIVEFSGFKSPTNGSCSGYGCCEVPFAAEVDDTTPIKFAVSFKPDNSTNWVDREEHPCSYGMVVESSWYNFSSPDLYGYEVLSKKLQRGVPFVIDFAIMTDQNGSCPAEGEQPPPGYACARDNSFCTNTTSTGSCYVCKCKEHYEGNPYVNNGCQDIDGCKNRDLYPCSSDGVCKNRLGGYDCPCKHGMKGDGKAGTCKDIVPLVAKVIVEVP